MNQIFTRIRLYNITTPKFAILALQTTSKCYRPLQRLRQHDGVTIQRCSADVVFYCRGLELFPRTHLTFLYIGYTGTRVQRARRQKSRQVTVPLIQWVCSTVLLRGWYSYKNGHYDWETLFTYTYNFLFSFSNI